MKEPPQPIVVRRPAAPSCARATPGPAYPVRLRSGRLRLAPVAAALITVLLSPGLTAAQNYFVNDSSTANDEWCTGTETDNPIRALRRR